MEYIACVNAWSRKVVRKFKELEGQCYRHSELKRECPEMKLVRYSNLDSIVSGLLPWKKSISGIEFCF